MSDKDAHNAAVDAGAVPRDAPPYTLRRSAKASRISLRILPGKGLEVVLPCWADASVVPEVLARHGGWVRRHLDRTCRDTSLPAALPETLSLRGGLEELRIVVEGAPGFPSARAKGPDAGASRVAGSGVRPPEPVRRNLVLPPGDLRDSLYRLRERLREDARCFLGGRLEELSQRHGLAYARLSVRFQKTRWGSCSAKGAISLNAGLLFLPDRLSTYIIRHELCHTRHMHHAAPFWKLLFSLDPDALAKDKAMRGAWRHIPSWLYTL